MKSLLITFTIFFSTQSFAEELPLYSIFNKFITENYQNLENLSKIIKSEPKIHQIKTYRTGMNLVQFIDADFQIINIHNKKDFLKVIPTSGNYIYINNNNGLIISTGLITECSPNNYCSISATKLPDSTKYNECTLDSINNKNISCYKSLYKDWYINYEVWGL